MLFSSVALIVTLCITVFIWLLWPIKKRPLTFNEKNEAISLYKQELSYLKKQHAQGRIDNHELTQLIQELDKKSAHAITAIENKPFTYRRSYIPACIIILCITAASGYYSHYYYNSGVYAWHTIQQTHTDDIDKGLFDSAAMQRFLQNHDNNTNAHYCFAMQYKVLRSYDTNPTALQHLASCHLYSGYVDLARQAVRRGLESSPRNRELNYLSAEIDFVVNQDLSPLSVERLITIIKQDPTHFNSLRLLALHSLHKKDYDQARFFINELKNLSNNDPQLFAALHNIEITIGKTLIQQKNSIQESQARSSLAVSISLSQKIKPLVSSPHTLFIIIKDHSGQLISATKHHYDPQQASHIITISDSSPSAMRRQRLADYTDVSIVARISRNGNPLAATGDLTSIPLNVSLPIDSVVPLTIDHTIP